MECLNRCKKQMLTSAPTAQNLLQRLLADVGYVPVLLAVAVLVCFTGNALIKITDPVESNYALTAMEMLQSGDYVSPRIFGNYWYDKPVLFYWELMAAFSLFGTTEFAARFFPSVFGLVGVVMAYGFASRLYDKKTGFVAALVLVTSLEYFYLSHAVITDMTLFVFFSATLMLFYLAYSEGWPRLYYGAYACAALAVLTKGPVGLVLPGLIIVLFLLWRKDFKSIFLHIKLFSGLLLFFVIAGLWYVPMYVMHGGDFISQFIGVHNVLRATVSEHPRDDVWYYYTVVFLLGFFPWVFTLPLAVKKYKPLNKLKACLRAGGVAGLRRTADSLSMKEQFLVTWAVVVFIFYQCMATKYITYTFPYMIPIAIAFAAYLRHHERLVAAMTAAGVVFYMVITFFVAVPMCRSASAYDAAQAVQRMADGHTCVAVYGGRYPVSLAYYSGYDAKRLKWADEIEKSLPGGISWNAKNIMPFMAIEDLAQHDRALILVHENEDANFRKAGIPGTWVGVKKAGRWLIYENQ
ncbi:glycosyltransferase family 39 protein [uncultured Megasphaera sp.]|uniref:ArnT family glycosyltransferase n=1 Tax=uncultured Megasphaera sp. TaxID=165188 RepID=UPI00265CE10D|nr:glycosyltransferase family 39 protein [uncultured Megasphaera sp.]